MHTETTTQTEPRSTQRPSARGPKLIGMAVIVLLLAGGMVSIWSRIHAQKALAAETEQAAVPSVLVMHPKFEKPDEQLVLPATLQAYAESPVYARTNGYLLKWYKDIGSRVTKGELLADIDTPEVDQELMQARAAREQAVAKLQLAQSSAVRWEDLRKSDSVSQQETDEKVSGLQQAKADLAAADANLKRLQMLESFKHVYAPFSGVITKRNIDVGSLINAGNSGSNHELFDIASVNPLRVFINVPQAYAPQVHPGQSATIEMSEYAGQAFSGKVVRSSEAIDPSTRTLMTEIDVPNPDGKLLPGSFAQVKLAAHSDQPNITIPVNAILFRQEGPRAAVVGTDGKVHLRKLTIGRDYGTTVEVLTGLQPTENVVLNPPDSLEEGQQVQVTTGGQS